MKNGYEMPEVIELGQASSLVMGEKVIDPLSEENVFGTGYRFLETDIDESDE